MKKSLAVFIYLLLTPFYVYSGDISCGGQVTLLMADNLNCTDNDGKKQLAFRLEGSPLWFCNNSDTASSLVLAAKVSGKSITVYMSDAGGATCQSHAQYIKPSYTFIP